LENLWVGNKARNVCPVFITAGAICSICWWKWQVFTLRCLLKYMLFNTNASSMVGQLPEQYRVWSLREKVLRA